MQENEMFEQYQRLVGYFVNRIYDPVKHKRFDMNDAYQEGCIGLLKAIRTFKPEKEIKFMTYASRCITNNILMLLRREKKQQYQLTLDAPVHNQKEETKVPYLDLVASSVDIEKDMMKDFMTNEILYFFEKEHTTLYYQTHPKHRERDHIIFDLMKKGYTQREISQMFGISQSYVSRIEAKILKEIHKGLETKEII